MDNQEIEIELQDEPIEMEIENSDTVTISEENVIESISVNGVEQPVDENKNVDIIVPTKISDLANDNNTVQDANYVHTDNNFKTEEKTKLANLENYDDTEIKADIQELETNKANKSETYTKTETDTLLQGKADTEDIPDVSEFITRNVNDLVNYTKSSDMVNAINTAVGNETTARENSDVILQNQIDAITSASDVVDVVGTYTDLQNYDITKLTDKDLIKVMQDSTHNNALSYFRWLNNAWSYVGSEGPFYTKSENDILLNEKQNEINSNNKLNADLVDDTNSANKFTNTTEKQTWNNKYDKPSGGIPKTDLASAVQTSLDKADAANKKIWTAQLSTTWTGNSAPYTQSISIEDMLATYKANVDLLMSDTISTAITEQEEFAKVSRVDSQAGSLLFTCYEEKPSIALNIRIEVVF